jgi:hypothetical protein
VPPRPIDGLQQAATDQATRIAQIAEQRHLQAELIAAAHQRADRDRAGRVQDPARSSRGDLRLPGEGEPHEGRGRRRRREDPPPEEDGPTGRTLDVTA